MSLDDYPRGRDEMFELSSQNGINQMTGKVEDKALRDWLDERLAESKRLLDLAVKEQCILEEEALLAAIRKIADDVDLALKHGQIPS